MAAVLEPKTDPASKYATQVDEQIDQATDRIRFHDLAFGGVLLLVIGLVYTIAAVVLDKYLVLPEWVRQVGLLGFLTTVAAVAYFTIIRPLRRQINPMYAAVQVEKTIDNAKNSVAGYVESRQNGGVNQAVQAAMAGRAARSMGQADLNRAVDHRSLLYTGAIGIVALLALVVLFFVFRPTQFTSLLGRAFVPFTSPPIATRTQLTLVRPESGDLTITAGQSVQITVHVGGKIPNAESPERVRLLLRHNPADPNYIPVALEPGETARDWQVRVPDYLIQNGFWYKVAGGDAETPEYKVTVRSLPLFTEYEARYEFPAYVRRQPEVRKDARLEAYRGTKVTLIARTNREVRDGRADIDPTGERVVGKPVPGQPDSLRFDFKLNESGTYKLTFTATTGERNADPPAYGIRVIADEAPVIEITAPADDPVRLPANGFLAVDAKIGDDFGIDTVVLKMRLLGAIDIPLADVPFQGGKSFLRASDNTWPTNLDYKDSVPFAQLKDATGAAVALKEGMAIEYWLEATDNCTEPKPNVGKSKVRRVELLPPKKDEEKDQLDNKAADRKQTETRDNKTQQKRLDTENRDPPQGNPEPKQDQPQPKDGNPEPKGGNPEPKQGETQPKEENPEPKGGNPEPKGGKPDPKSGEGNPDQKGGMNDPMPKTDTPNPKGGMNDPMPGGMPPPGGMNDPTAGNKEPDKAPMPKEPGAKDIEKQADQIQKQLNQDKQGGGSGKGNPAANDADRTEPGDPKPAPMGGEKPPDSPPKPEPKPADPMNPMSDPGSAGAPKPPGNVEQPPDPSAPKPAPQPTDPMNPMGGAKPPAETKPEPLGGSPATDKPPPEPKKDAGNPTDPMAKPEGKQDSPKQDGKAENAGTGKPASQQQPKPGDKTDTPMGTGTDPMTNPGEKPQDPAAGAGKPKPMTQPDRGSDKEPPADPNAGSLDNKKPEPGTGKPQKTPDAGTPKPAPTDPTADDKTTPKPPPMGGMGDPMKPDAGSPAETRPDVKAQPKAGEKSVDPATDKPSPDPTNPDAGNPDTAPMPKDKGNPGSPKGGGNTDPKIDPKEVADAAKDLTNPDPQKRQEARDKLDKAVGEQNRKEIEDIAKGMNSPDQKERAAAQEKLNDLKRKADELAKNDPKNNPMGGNPDQKIDPKDVADAVKDLTNPDPAKQKAAQDKLDKLAGQDARKQIEDIAKGLESNDPNERAAAQKKLDDLKRKADEFAKNNPTPKDTEPKNGEPKGGTDAKQPPDPKGTAQDPKQPKGKELTKQEMDDLVKKAGDLASKDDAKRQAAEKEFDDKFGKDARQQLQDAMNDPAKAEELKKKLDEMAKQGASGTPEPDGNRTPKSPGTPTTKVNPAMEDDPRNRAKSAQLQLIDFEKNQFNKDLHDKLGWTQEEYDRFLEGYRKQVESLQKQADDAAKADTIPAPKGTPGLNVGGGGKVDARPTAGTGTGGRTGTTFAPPGLSDAQKKFQEGASKLTPPKK